jgi:hypothetical protein
MSFIYIYGARLRFFFFFEIGFPSFITQKILIRHLQYLEDKQEYHLPTCGPPYG